MAKKISTTQERLAEMMRELSMIPADIVRKTGINKSTLSNYINGKRVAVQDQISKIADAYGIDPAWLMGYDVPMKAPLSLEDYDPGLIERALEYYQGYESLLPEQKAALDEIYQSFLRSGSAPRD